MRKFAFIVATLALAACSSQAPVEEKPAEPATETAKPTLTPEEAAKQEKEIADFEKQLAAVKTSNEARKLGRGKPSHLAALSINRADELQKEENERRKKLEAKK